MGVLIVRFIILPGPLSLRWVVLRRWIMCWGTIMGIRGMTIIVTPLPNPDSTCEPIIQYPDNLFMEAFMIAITKDLTCEDVMFSGHTVCMTCAMLIIMRYVPLAPWTSKGASRSWFSLPTAIRMCGYVYIFAAFTLSLAVASTTPWMCLSDG